MKQHKSVREFEVFLRNEHRSEHTVRAYVFAVRNFYAQYQKFSTAALNRCKIELLDRYKPQTVNQRICALNQYLRFMQAHASGPAARLFCSLKPLKLVRLQQKSFLENVISNSDFNYLKTQLLRDGCLRWYYILRLLTATGVRVSELLQMKYEHLEAGFMEICGKAGKTRRVLIPQELCREAMDYYRKQRITSGFIILNAKGKPVTARGIAAMLKTFALRYHMNEHTMHPHAFRHLYAQNFLKKYPDISLLADLMGHDSIETTRIYLKKSGAQQRKLVDQVVTW